MRQPTVLLEGHIGWRLRFSEICFDEPPYLVMQAVPVFPGASDQLIKRDIVWDVFSLIDSVSKPGAYQVLNCSCGYAPDAGLNEFVLVSHPDDNSVIWEMDIPGLRPALDDAFACDEDGFIRLIFARDRYEAAIRALLRDVQHTGNALHAVGSLDAQVCGARDLLETTSPEYRIGVDELEPDKQGLALERLRELDADAPWPRAPMWPTGTVLEFGFFPFFDGHELLRINGELPRPSNWPSWYFTRWEVMSCFKAWMSTVHRTFGLTSRYTLPEGTGQNEFVLVNESDQARCHEAGRRLAAAMQASLEEGETAPAVSVRYCESPLKMAAPVSF